MPGMIRFDASNPNNISWTNETLWNGSYGIQVPNLEAGNLVYLPLGDEGVLVNRQLGLDDVRWGQRNCERNDSVD